MLPYAVAVDSILNDWISSFLYCVLILYIIVANDFKNKV